MAKLVKFPTEKPLWKDDGMSYLGDLTFWLARTSISLPKAV